METNTFNLYDFYLSLILAIVQSISMIALIVYVVKTWQIAKASRISAEASAAMLRQMQETREADMSPNVVAYFDIDRQKDLLHLVIKNIGRSLAKDVKLEFKPPLRNTENVDLNNSSFVKNGVGTIPPNYEVKITIDYALNYFNTAVATGVPPLTYYVKITYFSDLPPGRRTVDMVMDLTPYVGFIFK
jgi:hypothetical protein